MLAPEADGRWVWIGVGALIVATALAYLPALDAGFLTWDDDAYIRENRLVRDPRGLWTIWNPAGRTLPAYYPVVFSSFWAEYRLFGPNPLPYHVTNVLLHLANVALAFLVARRLEAPRGIALAAAAVFALHPVQTESVMWIAERKNLLSALFLFATVLLYLRHRRTGRVSQYAASILLYALALLSKTQVVALPLFLAAWEWLRGEGKNRRVPASGVLARLLPMLALSLVAATLSATFEREIVPEWYDLPLPEERPFIAARAAWFYVGKLLLPVGLSPIHAKWPVDPASLEAWAALLSWPLLLATVLRWRRALPPLPLLGATLFLAALLPVLGLWPFAWQHLSFVGNHFLYISCLGGGLAIAALAGLALDRAVFSARRLLAVAAIPFLGLLALQTHREARHWRNDVHLWRHAASANPGAWIVHLKLGRSLERLARRPEALESFQRAIGLTRPGTAPYHVAWQHYLRTLERVSGPEAVIRAATAELGANPNAYVAYLSRALSRERLGDRAGALADFKAAARLTPPGSTAGHLARLGRDRLRSPTGTNGPFKR